MFRKYVSKQTKHKKPKKMIKRTLKLKTFLSERALLRNWKDNPQERRTYLHIISLVPRTCEELLKLNNKKVNSSILKWAKNLNSHFSKEEWRPNGPKARGAVVNVIGHQSFAAQNHSVIPHHTH